MGQRGAESIAALVILRSASGAAPGGWDRITAENVAEHLPSDADSRRARSHFRDAGFVVGPIVGTAFSIEASRAAFEAYFGVDLVLGTEGVLVVGDDGERGRDLPLDVLPAEVSASLVSVTFEPPAELDDAGGGLDV